MKKLSDQQKIDAVNEYLTKNINVQTLATKYGIVRNSMASILQRRGVKIKVARKYPFNENYFDKLDSPNKAYWLGFLYGDGCNDEGRGAIILVLQDRDKEIIDLFRKDLELEKPAFLVNRSNDKDSKNRRNQYRLEICSRHFSQSLVKLGCFKAKSLILKFPTREQVPLELMNHFMRGYLDSDGYFTRYKNKIQNCYNYKVDFGSSSVFCDGYKQFIKEVFGIHVYINHPPTKHELFRTASISGKNQCKTILDWAYKGTSLYLNRKYIKYQQMFLED